MPAGHRPLPTHPSLRYLKLEAKRRLAAGEFPVSRRGRVAKGWADLERSEILDTGHLFPASGLAWLVTSTAVLCLVAEGRFALDTVPGH